MRTKRITAAASAAALILTALLFTACTGSSPPAHPPVETASEDMTQAAQTAATEPPAPVEEEPKITVQTARVGICLSRTENGDNERLMTELPRALELRGFSPENIISMKMTGSRGRQGTQVDACLEEGCSILILSAVEDDRIPGIADRVSEAGAMAVFVNCSPGEEEIARWEELSMPCVWLGIGKEQETACQMSILHDYSGTERGIDFNGDGSVGAVLVGGDDDVRAALRETAADLGTELKILGETDSVNSQEISDYLQTVINEHQKEIELVLCGAEDQALAAAEGVDLRHRLVGRDILVIGSDAHEESCTAIINKLMSGSVFMDFYEQAYLAAGAAKDLLEGNQAEKTIQTVIFKVTEENAQEVLDQLWKAKEIAEEAERAAADAAAAAQTGETAAAAAEEAPVTGETSAAAEEVPVTGETSAAGETAAVEGAE